MQTVSAKPAVPRRTQPGLSHPTSVVVALGLCLLLVSCSGPTSEPAADASNEDMLAGTEPVGSASPPLAVGDHEIVLNVDGRDRSYIVHVPRTAVFPAPVVIALHGGGGTGAGFQSQNGLDAIADREGFIAVYPEGTGRFANRLHTWNGGDTCCGYAHDQEIDDVGFLRQVVLNIAESGSIDSNRVYVTGHSNGAMMAYRFATEASDLVTAIAAVAGAPDLAPQSGAQPVPVLHIHSADDPRALYEGGEGPPFPGTDRTVYHEAVEAGLERWATGQNQCDPEPVGSAFAPTGRAGPEETATLYRWQGCAPGADFQHLLLTGSGHGWPGVTVGRFWQNQLGEPTTIIDASEEVWAFVSQFTSS